MDILELIKSRRSCRSYTDKPIPKKTVERIIEAGINAPSAMNRQPWRFIVLDDKARIQKISKLIVEQVKKKMPSYTPRDVADPFFYGAPLVIFITAEENDWASADCALAAQNMMLYARSEGIGSCFIGFASFLNGTPGAAEAGLKKGCKIYATLILGYPTEWPSLRERKKVKDYL